MIDKRNSPRRAAIILPGSAQKIPCVVRNLSKVGGSVQVYSTKPIPETFEVVIDGQPHYCRVVWRTAKKMGVTFENEAL